jgi:cobalt-zinc-cadmium resistance protein CzcA
MELRSLLDWFVAYELRSVPGVVEVNAFGGELKTYEVEVLPDRLRALNVSLNDLFEALERNNATAGGGYLTRSGEQLLVRGEGRIQSLDEIGDVLIETRADGVPVRVRDVGRVHFAPLIRQGAVTRDGRGEVVTGIVMMLVGANGREVVDDVKARIAQIGPSLPARRPHRRLLRPLGAREPHDPHGGQEPRRGRALRRRGALPAAREHARRAHRRGGDPLRHAGGLHRDEGAGLSGNLMSLGAIDFGIVVDGSIIVVENAVVHLAAAARGRARPMTMRGADVVLQSTLDVRAARSARPSSCSSTSPSSRSRASRGRCSSRWPSRCSSRSAGAFIASLTFVPVLVATFMRQHTEEHEPFVVRLLHRVYPAAAGGGDGGPKVVIASLVLLLLSAGGGLAHGRGVRAAARRGRHRDPGAAAPERVARGERAGPRASSGCCVSSPR